MATLPATRPARCPARCLVRWGVPAAVLAVLGQRFGAGPFLRALDRVTLGSVVVALVVTAATTVCAAGRWAWVARRLDLELEVRTAVAAYYRSQLLNQVLPGGVLGDVERAVRHGRGQAAIGRSTRAVAWERVAGQAGLLALALVLVVGLPSGPGHDLGTGPAWAVPAALAVAVAVALAGVLMRRRAPGTTTTAAGAVAGDLHRLTRDRLPWVPLLLSVAAAAGHLVVMVVALRTAGVGVPLLEAVPVLAVVLVASSLPTNIAGWGPREGAAAWVFAATGMAAADGVTVAAVYGILSLAAAAPGLVLLAVEALPGRRAAPTT